VSIVEKAMAKLRRIDGPKDPSSAPATVASLMTVMSPPVLDAPAKPVETRRKILIDRDHLRNLGYLPDSSLERQFADYFRRIKRPLIAAAAAPAAAGRADPRLIILASALPGDGKTFTSINLALSMAREHDVSVVLVDADVPKPHISRIFGVDQEPGLLEALTDESVDVESLILSTDVPGLSILPAGKPREGATELLASARMAKVAGRLFARDAHRIAIFDSPPLLVSSESRALCAVAGQIVLVVCSGKTPRHAVLDALEQFDDRASISLVLNQSRASMAENYYGYGGSYDPHDSPGESRKRDS
jgi:protein-tyrosine kinase